MKRKDLLRRTFSAIVFLAASQPFALCQVKDVNSALSSVGSMLKNLFAPLANVVGYVIGLVGLIMTVIAMVKFSKGDQTSGDAFVKLGGGILMAFIAIQALKLLI